MTALWKVSGWDLIDKFLSKIVNDENNALVRTFVTFLVQKNDRSSQIEAEDELQRNYKFILRNWRSNAQIASVPRLLISGSDLDADIDASVNNHALA